MVCRVWYGELVERRRREGRARVRVSRQNEVAVNAVGKGTQKQDVEEDK
jgi:hypothetical protein